MSFSGPGLWSTALVPSSSSKLGAKRTRPSVVTMVRGTPKALPKQPSWMKKHSTPLKESTMLAGTVWTCVSRAVQQQLLLLPQA